MKLGTEKRWQVIVLGVLGVIALGSLGRSLWPSSASTPPPAAQVSPGPAARPAMRRTASGKFVKAPEPRLDPTLDLDLLRRSEEIKYSGKARNIFVAGSMPEIEKPITNPALEKQAFVPPTPPPPQPINLKFFGFANKPGEAKRIFLSQGEDIFIAGEGDIVNRRYRVLRIAPSSVEIEDVLNNNRQSIPLIQG